MKEIFNRVSVKVVGVAVLLMIAAGLAYIAMDDSGPGPADYSRVLAGAQTYRVTLQAMGEQIPGSVTLKELIQAGVIAPADVSAFDGYDVWVSLNDETGVDDPLMRVRLPDGHEFVVSADGSVQPVSGGGSPAP